jgi:hypothetical protein
MSDVVHANPQDVKKLAQALTHLEQELLQATKAASRAIDRADWRDGRKDQFVARYNDFNKKTNSFVGGELRQMVKGLNNLAQQLERARDQRF